jgi:uncharacterized protein YggE
MKRFVFALLVIVVAFPGQSRGQVGGNLGFSQGGAKARAEQLERSRRTLPDGEKPPTGTATFVEADVLMNVKADEFVAVFGLAQEGETVADCSRKMEEVAKEFTDAIKAMGIGEDDLFLDFVTQTKVYGFEMAGNIAKEKLVGFELRKNLSIHYKDRAMLDKLAVVAARSRIYDLIKVDYVVKDVEAIHDRLMDEAAKVVKRKTARYEKLLGIKLQPPAQVYAERYGASYPSGMYDSYTAADSEQIVGGPDRQRYTVQSIRKGRTFVFNGLDGDGFDVVVNPVIIEPVVQFTLHLKVKYEVEQIKAR